MIVEKVGPGEWLVVILLDVGAVIGILESDSAGDKEVMGGDVGVNAWLFDGIPVALVGFNEEMKDVKMLEFLSCEDVVMLLRLSKIVEKIDVGRVEMLAWLLLFTMNDSNELLSIVDDFMGKGMPVKTVLLLLEKAEIPAVAEGSAVLFPEVGCENLIEEL